jgi:ABC-type nitrate/sulfonate/bicarbonate transport system ATPase subunit
VVVLTPRPGRVERVVDVDLPQPRSEKTRALPRFFELVTLVRVHLVEDPAIIASREPGVRGG